MSANRYDSERAAYAAMARVSELCQFRMDDGAICGRTQERDGDGPYCGMHRGQFQRDVEALKATNEDRRASKLDEILSPENFPPCDLTAGNARAELASIRADFDKAVSAMRQIFEAYDSGLEGALDKAIDENRALLSELSKGMQ